jgi:hypothetical protein
MKSYSDYLVEAVNAKDVHVVALLIQKYLTKRVGQTFHRMPGYETFMVAGKTFTGVRFFYKTDSCVRFNWLGKSLNQDVLDSITIWKNKDTKFDVTFDHSVSIVKILPQIVDILKTPRVAEFDFVPVDVNESELTEAEVLNEMSSMIADNIRAYVAKMNVGDKIGYREVKLALGRPEFKLFQVIVETNPSVFDTSGKSPVFIGSPSKIDYAKALEAAGGATVRVSKSMAKEQDITPGSTNDLEDEAEKVAYADQLQHLRGFVRLIKSGATNLLMLTGPGGTGKCLRQDTELDIRTSN